MPAGAGAEDGLQGNGRPCRLLLAGAGDRGQQAVAGAALKLLSSCGGGEGWSTVSLPELVVAGGGDASAGCTSLMRSALRRRAPCLQGFLRHLASAQPMKCAAW